MICQEIIQFPLAFKDKGHKSLEYCCQCLVIHLTSVGTISRNPVLINISTNSLNAESNGGIFILIVPLGIYTNTRSGQTASNLSTIRTASDLLTIQFRLIFKGHKSLEYWCLVIHLTSVSTISYAESNGGRLFFTLLSLSSNRHYKYNNKTISYFTLSTLQFSRTVVR